LVAESEKNWMEAFARPMIAKRHQVDSGDSTVSDLQIFYLQHDPATEVTKSTTMLDDASRSIRRTLDESNASAASATTFSSIFGFTGTVLAVLFGILIAYYTAKSITDPLRHLIGVAREIGETGNIDQTIDIHRSDEVGLLADNFNKMIVHLKEMASVSAAIAEGQLNVSIQPRSPSDTMANAYIRMVDGLQDPGSPGPR
jgi:methyl-accepting chemotaxis protein